MKNKITYTIEQSTRWGSLTDEDRKKLFSGKFKQIITESQLYGLPPGMQVIIWWTGGNGPHIYEISSHRNGNTYVKTTHYLRQLSTSPDSELRDRVDFIGRDKPYTLVWVYKRVPNNNY